MGGIERLVMITAEMTERIAEMAKIKMNDSELAKAREELCKMAGFAKEISAVADSIDIPAEEPNVVIRDEDRAACSVNTEKLADSGMHIRDGFFHIEAGARK